MTFVAIGVPEPKYSDRKLRANKLVLDQTAPLGLPVFVMFLGAI